VHGGGTAGLFSTFYDLWEPLWMEETKKDGK